MEKARGRLRHVRMRETNASEPLLKHRNRIRWHQNQGLSDALGSAWRQPKNARLFRSDAMEQFDNHVTDLRQQLIDQTPPLVRKHDVVFAPILGIAPSWKSPAPRRTKPARRRPPHNNFLVRAPNFGDPAQRHRRFCASSSRAVRGKWYALAEARGRVVYPLHLTPPLRCCPAPTGRIGNGVGYGPKKAFG